MSLITRCPACATMFKVVPDQLRVSEGWVRCGQCSEVFDANLHLQSSVTATEMPPSPPSPPAVDPPVSEPAEAEPVAAAAEPFLEVNPHALYIDPLDAPDPVTRPEPESPQEPTLDGVPAASVEPVEEAAQVVESDDGETFHHAFLKPSGAPAKPQRRWVRVALALVSVVLGAALVLQVVVRERDRIVALEPATRAALEPLCTALGCALAPLRQIESVVIDSSSFTKLRGDIYRLVFSLKNTSPLPLATPALELTLTDMQDQTVVRKVFLAPEFAEQRMVLEPGAELPANLSVALKFTSASSEKIAGYRLLSFYP